VSIRTLDSAVYSKVVTETMRNVTTLSGLSLSVLHFLGFCITLAVWLVKNWDDRSCRAAW